MSLPGRLLRRLLALLVGPLVAWVNDNALAVAGGVAAALAGGVLYGRLLAAGALAGPTVEGADPAAAASVLAASPAYVVTVLAGLWVLVFWRR